MSQFVLPVADDVPGKSTSKDPRQSRLIVRTTLSPKVKASLEFVINGRRIEPAIRRGGVYLFDQSRFVGAGADSKSGSILPRAARRGSRRSSSRCSGTCPT